MNGDTITVTENDIYVVPDEVLKQLRQLVSRRDEQAFILGQATIEVEARKRDLAKLEESERKTRFGALLYELHKTKEDVWRHIQASEESQKRLGEESLRALGLDPDKRELTIDLSNGAVMQLVGGQWLPVLK